MNKEELLKRMVYRLWYLRENNIDMFTCHELARTLGVDDYINTTLPILESYKDWLMNSIYMESAMIVPYNNYLSITVKLNKRDYEGKLAMFKEFLDQYEGPL